MILDLKHLATEAHNVKHLEWDIDIDGHVWVTEYDDLPEDVRSLVEAVPRLIARIKKAEAKLRSIHETAIHSEDGNDFNQGIIEDAELVALSGMDPAMGRAGYEPCGDCKHYGESGCEDCDPAFGETS